MIYIDKWFIDKFSILGSFRSLILPEVSTEVASEIRISEFSDDLISISEA